MRCLLLIILLSGFASEALALSVFIAAKVDGEGRPAVHGTTNLPDGTEMIVSVERKSSAYSGQDKVTVSHGQFRAGPFSQKGMPVNPGTYALRVTVPYAPVQPASVQAVIGKHGEKLQGPLVKKGALGKGVQYNTTFTVGGKVSAGKDKTAKLQDKKDRHEWWKKSCKDICIASQVQSGDLINFDWDRCFNTCLAEEGKK